MGPIEGSIESCMLEIDLRQNFRVNGFDVHELPGNADGLGLLGRDRLLFQRWPSHEPNSAYVLETTSLVRIDLFLNAIKTNDGGVARLKGRLKFLPEFTAEAIAPVFCVHDEVPDPACAVRIRKGHYTAFWFLGLLGDKH